MIHDLSVYANWKRYTLERLTAKFRRKVMKIFEKHRAQVESAIEIAIRAGDDKITLPNLDIDAELLKVFIEHQENVARVGVADGMREIDPETKLSTWHKWPINYPVEQTFVSLAETKKFNYFSDKTIKKIRSKYNRFAKKMARITKQKYLDDLKTVYKKTARGFLIEDDTDTTKDKVREVFKTVFKKTDNHAEMIFRTETTRYFNEARLDYFNSGTDVDFVQLVVVADGRLSNICESRRNYVLPIGYAGQKKFKPPFHPYCRTVQSPLDTDLKEDTDEVRRNLGSEFGKIISKTSGKEFTGRRAPPSKPLPNGWA